jgi:PAS domain S-box-containing protein
MTKGFAIGVGACEDGPPLEQGRSAALQALSHVQGLPPALAIVAGGGRAGAGEILRGVREALGACPVVGCVSDVAPFAAGPTPLQGVRVFLCASPHVTAKVGAASTSGASWEQQAYEAFRGSYVQAEEMRPTAPSRESDLWRWYRYRRPSLALVVVISPPGKRRERVRNVATFLRERLYGRVPFILFSHAPEGEEPAVLADGRVVTEGVVLVMVKTGLQFSLERFHHFEPLGVKLFATRTEGSRILEFNGRPALQAYLSALGLPSGAWQPGTAGAGLFSLFPFASRGRDGRYHLLLADRIGSDGSIDLPGTPALDHALYPMRAISSPEVLRARAAGVAAADQEVAGAVLLRNRDLRDAATHPAAAADAGQAFPTVELAVGTELEAYLTHRDWEGEAGHLLIVVYSSLNATAVAAAENERLLGEIVRIKELNQKVLDGIGDGIALVGEGGSIQHCNDAYRAIMGLGAGEVQGRICPLLRAASGACSPCVAMEALERQSFVTREVARPGDAGTTWLRLEAFPLRDEAGRATAAVEVIRDVTVYKRLSESLESERLKMEAVVHGMAETLYIVGPRHELQFFHRGALPRFGEAGGATPGGVCFEVLFGRDSPCPWCRLEQTLTTGEVDRRVAHVPGVDGEECAYQITFSPWRDEQGVTKAVACLLVDITAEKRVEQQMIRSEKLNSLAILSAGMAHELNNPLGAITFNLEVLKRRDQDREYQEVLGSIRRDVVRINRIVGNLLSFSRSGVTSFTWLQVTEVIDAALELFQPVMERRKVQVRRSYQPEVPPIWGNPQDLQQVFINLIANAVDAMPAGGAIEVAASSTGTPGPRPQGARIAVVYDRHEDVAILRTLLGVPEWGVSFLRSYDEAIDHLRQCRVSPPDVLLLDYASPDRDRVNFFLTMAAEAAPEARVLLIDGTQAPEEELRDRMPGVHRFLRRPLDARSLLDAVRPLLPAREAPGTAPVVSVVFGDTGIGIPAAIRERIFDPFFTTKSENKGTGLGLSVVHKIVENHGATIRVESAPGEGTTFVLGFPLGGSVEPSAAAHFPGGGAAKGAMV